MQSTLEMINVFTEKAWKLANWKLTPHCGCQDPPCDSFSDLYNEASGDVIAQSLQ